MATIHVELDDGSVATWFDVPEDHPVIEKIEAALGVPGSQSV